MGKSALCGWAVAQAREMRVLVARGVQSEADLPYAGLSELFADQRDLSELLPGPQVRAMQAVLARGHGPPVDRFAIGAAVLSLLAAGNECNSTLVVVDDGQWLDASSADALLFAARRMRWEGVALLVATRPGGAFDRERTDLSHLTIGALDPPSARTLLVATHGELPAEVVSTLVDGTHGNPLALVEVPRMLSDAQLAGEEPIDEPLPTGVSLTRAFLGQLADLTASTRRALLVAAASGIERVQPVLDALGVLGLNAGELDAAEEARVVAIVGERFEFRHPLLRSAIYHGASGPERRAAHAALARATSGEPQAWHLAQATVGEDETVAARLETVAVEARRRGALSAAAAALERAARLSEDHDARVRRLTQAARDAYITGRVDGAMCMLDRALDQSPNGVQRADVQHVRGRILMFQGHANAAFQVLCDAADLVRDTDASRATAMLAEACLACVSSGDIETALATARKAARLGDHAEEGVRAFAASKLANSLTLSGERAAAVTMLDSVLPALRGANPLSDAGELITSAARCYSWLERYDVATELLDRLIASARKASAPASLPWPLACRAEVDVRTGRWAIARAYAEEAVCLGHELGQSAIVPFGINWLALLRAAAGDEHGCRQYAAQAQRLVELHNFEPARAYIKSTLGLLELGLGRAAPAIDHLETVREIAERRGLREPSVVHWQPDLIEAYVRSGQFDAAEDVLAVFDEQARATGGRWAVGTAARCRGLLADDREADCSFLEALEKLAELPAPFEVARTQLCWGERLRRRGMRTHARTALRAAIETFEHLGASAWAARAWSEHGATGAKPKRRRDDRARDELTPQELQVALIVASGASNREAASALFLSTKTIEFHLAHIYRKLGVRTRAQLAARAATRGWLDSRTPAAVGRQT